MEIDQTEESNVLFNHSTKVLNENQEAEETGALTTFKRDNRFRSILGS